MKPRHTRHPLHKDWPLEMVSVFTFEDQPGGQDQVHGPLVAPPSDGGRAQDVRYQRDSMRQGWGGTLDQLVAYLAKKA